MSVMLKTATLMNKSIRNDIPHGVKWDHHTSLQQSFFNIKCLQIGQMVGDK